MEPSGDRCSLARNAAVVWRTQSQLTPHERLQRKLQNENEEVI